jgi:hypothetical protein
MPLYPTTGPFAPPAQLLQSGGNPVYAFGSRVANQPTTRMQVTTVAANGSNNATVGVKILEGPIPLVGELISIIGTTSASAAYNVTNIAISGVAIDATTGVGTITFPLTTAQLATTADIGIALVPRGEVGEALTNNSSSVQFAIPDPASGADSNARNLTWSTSYPSVPGSITATLQGSSVDVDSAYQTLDTSTALGGEVRQIAINEITFVRVRITNLTGGAPKVIIRLIT